VDRVLRIIIHHPIQLLFLLILPVAIGGAIAYLQPRQYQATATILALHRYDTLTATSVDSANLATPAETQATVISELLLSRSFTLAVAREAQLASTLNASALATPQSRDDALFADISQHTLAQAQGYELFTISYTNTNPQMAQQVVAAIVDNYAQESQHIVSNEGQTLLETYQTQLTQVERAQQNAVLAESQYIQAHQTLTQSQLQSDPQYQQLHTQTLRAQLNVQNIETSITSLEQEIATHSIGAASLFQILDAPTVPTKPASRLKIYLLGGGGGLAIALLACTIYVILVNRGDRRVYSSLDVLKFTDYPVIMEIPRLSPRTVGVLVKMSRRPDPVASNGRNER